MGSVLPARSVGYAVAFILIVLLVRFTYKLIKIRCHVRSFIKETGMVRDRILVGMADHQ
jgi:hypothetical protein